MIVRLWQLLSHPNISIRMALRLWAQEYTIKAMMAVGYEFRAYRIQTDDFCWRGKHGDKECADTGIALFHAGCGEMLGMYVRRCK